MRRRRRSGWRWAGRIGAGLVIALVAAATAVVLIARSEWGRRKIGEVAVERLQGELRGKVRIGRIGGALPREIVLEDVELRDAEGQVALAARRVRLVLELEALVGRKIEVSEAQAEGALVVARRLGDGRLNLAELSRPSRGGTGKPWEVVVRRAVADGRARVERREGAVEAVAHLEGGLRIGGEGAAIEVERLSAELTAPGAAKIEAAGRIGLDKVARLDGVRLAIDSDGAALARLVPGTKLAGPIAARVVAEGPIDRLVATAQLEVARGTATVEGRLADGRWEARVEGRGLDVGAWRGAPSAKLAIDGNVRGAIGGRTVEVSSLTVSGARVRVSATGRASVGGGIVLRGRVVSSDLARLGQVGVRGLAGRAAGRFAVRKSTGAFTADTTIVGRGLSAAGVRAHEARIEVHVDGERGYAAVEARDVWVAERRIDRVRIDVAGSTRGAAAGVDATGRGAHVVLEARARPRGEGATWQAWREGAEGRIGRLLVGGERGRGWAMERPAPFVFAPGEARLGPLALAAGGGHATIAASVVQGAIDARVDVVKVDAGAVARALVPGRTWVPAIVDGTVRATGTVAAPRVEARLDGEVRPPGRPAIAGRIEAGWERGRARVTADVGEGAARPLHVEGEAPLPWSASEPFTVKVRVRGLPLGWLAPWLPRVTGLTGELSLDARAAGTAAQPALSGEAQASWRYGGAAGRIAGSFASAEERSEVAIDASATGAGKAALRGSIALGPLALMARGLAPTAAVKGTVTLAAVELGKLPWPAAAPAWLGKSGRVDGRVAVDGPLAGLAARADVRVQNLYIAGVRPVEVSAVLAATRDGTDVSATVGVLGAELVALKGRVGIGTGVLRGAPLDGAVAIEARLRGYELARLRGLRTELDTLAGRLTGRVVVGGTVRRLRLEGDVAANGLAAAGVRFTRAAAHGTFADGVVGLLLDAPQVGGGGVRVDARVPIDRGQPMAASAEVRRFDLAFVSSLTDAIGQAHGIADARLAIAGTPAAPEVTGEVKLSAGSLSTEIGSFRGIELGARFVPGRLVLERLGVTSGRGTLVVSGDAALAGWRPTRVDLAAKAERFAVAAGGVGADFDGRLKLHAEKVAGGLGGKITVEKGVIHLPQLGAGRTLQPLGPLEDVVFVDAAARRRAARAKGAGIGATLALVVPGEFALRGREVHAELRGSLQVKLDGGKAVLLGSVAASGPGGWVEILGRRFAVDHARFGFAGEEPVDPTLDVRLTRQLSEAALVIDVTGTARKPKIALSSDPPVYDASQVIGLILSGDPSAQSVSQSTLDQKIVGALSGVIVSKLSQQLLPGLPIDVLKIDVGAQGFGGLATTRLEVGKYVTPDVYVSYVHQFGLISPLQRINPNQATVQWRFSRRLRLETTFGDAGIGSADVFFTLRF